MAITFYLEYRNFDLSRVKNKSFMQSNDNIDEEVLLEE